MQRLQEILTSRLTPPLPRIPRLFPFHPLWGDEGAEIIDDGSWFSWDIISQLRVSVPHSRATNAQCANNRISLKWGEYPEGGSYLSLAPRDPGQTNDGQFTSNRKNFLKLGLKWAKSGKRKEHPLAPSELSRGYERVLFQKASPGWKGEYGPWPWPCAFIIIFLSVDEVEHHYFHRYANIVAANHCYC